MDSTRRAANLRPERRSGRRDAPHGEGRRSEFRRRTCAVGPPPEGEIAFRSPSPRSAVDPGLATASGCRLARARTGRAATGFREYEVRAPGDAAVDKRTISAEGAAQEVLCAERHFGLHRFDGSEGDCRPRCPISLPRSAFPSLPEEKPAAHRGRRRPVFTPREGDADVIPALDNQLFDSF